MYKRNPTFRKQRSGYRSPFVLSCITLAVGIGVVAAYPEPFDPCRFPASRIRANTNSDVDACDNFYQFACGGYLNSNSSNGTQSTVLTKAKLQMQLKRMMESRSEPNELKTFRLVKNLYKSCMSKNVIKNQDFERLHNIIKKLGGWPVLDGEMWNETEFNWIELTTKSINAGYDGDYFILIGIGPDPGNFSKRLVYFEQPSLDILADDFSTGIEDDTDYMVDIAVILGADRKRASSELKESLAFEIGLAKVLVPSDKFYAQAKKSSPTTLHELSMKYPSIPWRNLITGLLPKTITVDENEAVIVIAPSFVSDLEKLLSKTPKRVQANYAMWRIIQDSLKYLNDDFLTGGHTNSTNKSNEIKDPSRWKLCIEEVRTNLDLGVSAMYVRNYFPEKVKKNVVEMAMNIRQQIGNMVKKAGWMDKRTRCRTLKKLKAMSIRIGYDRDLLNDKKLEEFYENLELSGENYLESILNVTAFRTKLKFSELRKPINRNDWDYDMGVPTDTNTQYHGQQNSLQISAGYFQDILFNIAQPQYINYGVIGSVIGNGIAHGLGYTGLACNKDGRLAQWSVLMTQCIIQQYGNYTVKEVGLKLNPIKTVEEDLADNVGIKAAYLAYSDWVERNEGEQKLPGLPYSQKQMFWISAANSRCGKFTPQELRRRIATSPHSPNEFRVIGMVSNMPYFSKDFNCPGGSKMNPPNKCSIW